MSGQPLPNEPSCQETLVWMCCNRVVRTHPWLMGGGAHGVGVAHACTDGAHAMPMQETPGDAYLANLPGRRSLEASGQNGQLTAGAEAEPPRPESASRSDEAPSAPSPPLTGGAALLQKLRSEGAFNAAALEEAS